jgi:hypothetical protein
MFVSNEVKGELNFSSLSLYLSIFIKHIKFLILKYFINFSFQSLLIWTNIILFLYNYKKINIKKRVTIILLLFGFFFTQSVFLFRYEQDTYFLNSEVLLIIPLAYIFEYLKSKKIFLIFLIGVILFSNISFLQHLKYQNSQSYCAEILGNDKFKIYYEYWTKNIPIEIVLNFCKDKI